MWTGRSFNTYLDQARKQGSRLAVGLNSDRSVKALKGPTWPLNPENQRACVLAALSAVDAVVLFDDDAPLRLILAIHLDMLAKGADYTEHQVVGAQAVQSWGGKLALLPLVEGSSTSNLIQKAQDQGASRF